MVGVDVLVVEGAGKLDDPLEVALRVPGLVAVEGQVVAGDVRVEADVVRGAGLGVLGQVAVDVKLAVVEGLLDLVGRRPGAVIAQELDGALDVLVMDRSGLDRYLLGGGSAGRNQRCQRNHEGQQARSER